ncbi:hypothetical protein H7169_00680 [Candidatus Gracilibacteria bacterium]|nr:hypothetical protein [Candidatus Gracilibacteria bacterium]
MNSSGTSDLIRSFGIINVKTIPIDSTLTLGTDSYSNNDKRMSDYGYYNMQISKSGYLTNTMEFLLDREKPFFIEKVTLLPHPSYEKLNGLLDLYQVANDEYITRMASGLFWSGALSSSKVNYSGSLEQIGGRYFRSGTGVLLWDAGKFEKANTAITNFVSTCEQVVWKYDLFSCPKSMSLLTEGGRYMTGILDIRNHLIARSSSITQISGGTLGKSWIQSGSTDLSRVFIIDGEYYTNNSGKLTPRISTLEILTIPLDNIEYASTLGEDTIFMGQTNGISHLIIKHSGDPIDRMRDIILPSNIDYSHFEFHSHDGNIMIETLGGLLFLYRGSRELVEIVEGNILSYSTIGSAYRKDGMLWWVSWSRQP